MMRDLTGNIAVIYVAETHDTEGAAHANTVGISQSENSIIKKASHTSSREKRLLKEQAFVDGHIQAPSQRQRPAAADRE